MIQRMAASKQPLCFYFEDSLLARKWLSDDIEEDMFNSVQCWVDKMNAFQDVHSIDRQMLLELDGLRVILQTAKHTIAFVWSDL